MTATPVTADAVWQLVGRLHPVLLHLPIGLLVGLIAVEIVELSRGRPLDRSVRATLAWLLAGSAALAMVTGLVLANEGGYDEDALARHRLLGIVFTVAAALLALLQRRIRQRALYAAGLVVCGILVVPVGHIGAGMTHGEQFLIAPFLPVERATVAPPVTNDAFVRTVLPILDAKCVSCHGATRRKAKLSLDSAQAVLAGGQSGPAIVPGDPAGSPLVRRIRLPLHDDDHMPPEGKPQLTDGEIADIERWIADGALHGDIAAGSDRGPPPEAQAPAHIPPPQDAMTALAEAQVHAEVVDPALSLLWVDASSARQLDDAALAGLLAPLSEWIADLSVAGTHAGAATLTVAAAMPRLSRLDLSATGVTPDALASLRGAVALETLNVSRTSLDGRAIETLAAIVPLRRVHAWRSGLGQGDVSAALERRPDLLIDLGDELGAAPVEVEPPPSFSSDAPLPVATVPPGAADALAPTNSTCPISGAPVNPLFVIVHEGRALGFCCEKCVAKFYADRAAK